MAGGAPLALGRVVWRQKEESIMAWKPIRRRGALEVRDVDEGSDRALLAFPLSDVPPREWAAHLEDQSRGQPYQYTVESRYVLVWSKRDQDSFTAWGSNVDRDAKAAGEYYQSLLADRERQREVRAEAERQHQEKLNEARGWAQGLEPPSDKPD
jgi:hypothetical protein